MIVQLESRTLCLRQNKIYLRRFGECSVIVQSLLYVFYDIGLWSKYSVSLFLCFNVWKLVIISALYHF